MTDRTSRHEDAPPVLGVDLAVRAMPGDVPLPLEDICWLEPVVPDPPGPTDIRRRNPRWQGEIGLTDDGGRYVIPAEAISARRTIGLGNKWEPYRVAPEALGLRPVAE